MKRRKNYREGGKRERMQGKKRKEKKERKKERKKIAEVGKDAHLSKQLDHHLVHVCGSSIGEGFKPRLRGEAEKCKKPGEPQEPQQRNEREENRLGREKIGGEREKRERERERERERTQRAARQNEQRGSPFCGSPHRMRNS